MRLFRRRKSTPDTAPDSEVARLSARADSIVEELDLVVKQMSEMLRKAPKDKR